MRFHGINNSTNGNDSTSCLCFLPYLDLETLDGNDYDLVTLLYRLIAPGVSSIPPA